EVRIAAARPVVWPLPGLDVCGITMEIRRAPAGVAGNNAPAAKLRCAAVRATFSPLQLLQGRLVMSRLVAAAPEVDLVAGLDGLAPAAALARLFGSGGVVPGAGPLTTSADPADAGCSAALPPVSAPAVPAAALPGSRNSPAVSPAADARSPDSVMVKPEPVIRGLFFDPATNFTLRFTSGRLRLIGSTAIGGRSATDPAADGLPVSPGDCRLGTDGAFSAVAVAGSGVGSIAAGVGAGLEMTRIEGILHYHARRDDMRLRFSGRFFGGRVDGDCGWRPAVVGGTDAGGVMLDAELRGVGLPAAELPLPSIAGQAPRATAGSVDFLLAAEGCCTRGLTMRVSLGLGDCGVELQAADGIFRPLLGPGFTGKLAASGYVDIVRRYLNLKSCKLELPAAATVYSRGLLKFHDRLLVDLLNDINIDDLDHCRSMVPAAFSPGFFPAGDLSGSCNLVGRPAELPVARIRLHSRRLSIQGPVPPAGVPAAATPELRPARRLPTVAAMVPPVFVDSALAGAAPAATGIAGRIAGMLVGFARSGVIADLAYTADRVVWNGVGFNDVSFVAHKQLTRLYVEQCRAALGDGGFRLSLVAEDLIHEPVWSASVRADRLDLHALLPMLPLRGAATGSLVLEGQADADAAVWCAGLRGRGEVSFAAGTVLGTPLTRALGGFAGEISDLPTALWPGAFARAAAEIEIDRRRWRLKSLEIDASDWCLRGAAVYDEVRERLSGSGSLTNPAGASWTLRVSGPPLAPYYRVQPE
ncbi:MAG: hypothetical protein JW781_03370, partial [Deltaproteobacteria bacterium]|nr:hypothetical protein [Candidatus Anaeroferrophillacea bacterium]